MSCVTLGKLSHSLSPSLDPDPIIHQRNRYKNLMWRLGMVTHTYNPRKAENSRIKAARQKVSETPSQ
jgi:hypothetical protein